MFEVADGDAVVVSGHPAERGTFELFLRALSLEHLADDPRFVDVAARQANFDALRADAARRGALDPRRGDVRGAVRRTTSSPAGVLRTARELAETDWARQRGAIVEVSDRGDGTIRIPNPPWHFSDADVAVRGPARYRGEDNREVLAELLGYDDATIDGLEADGVVTSRVPTSRP